MSDADSHVHEPMTRTLKFAVNGASDRVEKIENANIFAAKMGQKVVGVTFAEGSISLTSVKSSSNTKIRQDSQDEDLLSQKEIVDIALARHLEVVALENIEDVPFQQSPKLSPTDDFGMMSDGQLKSIAKSNSGNDAKSEGVSDSIKNFTKNQMSDLVLLVCFRSVPEVGQPAFPFSGTVFPLYFGCSMIGRGKLQCTQPNSNTLVEIPHNSVSKRHAKIDVLSDGSISVTDLHSTNGTCVGSSIESIMQSSNLLQENSPVSIAVGDYISFGVCICRIIPERARTGSRSLNLETVEFEPSAFALDQLRILKITMNLHRMVDEEGFSPLEMARIMSEKVGGESNLLENSSKEFFSGSTTEPKNTRIHELHRNPSILKRQHSSSSAVTFDIQNISEDEEEQEDFEFKNAEKSTPVDFGDLKSSARFHRPSTSNFSDERNALQSDGGLSWDSASLNLDTHSNDEVMRKMVLRLSQITKNLAEIQTVVLGRQNISAKQDVRLSNIEDKVTLPKEGFATPNLMQESSLRENSNAVLSRSGSFNGESKLVRQNSRLSNVSSDTSTLIKSPIVNELKDSEKQLLVEKDDCSVDIEDSLPTTIQDTTSEPKKFITMKQASGLVTTEVGTIRSVERLVMERKKDLRIRQLAIGTDRSSELNAKLYSFGQTSSGSKVRLYAPSLIHIFSFIDPIPGIFMLAGVNREMRTFCKRDELFFNLNLGHEKLRGTHVHERVTDKIIADMVMHRFRQVKIVNLQGCPFVTDQSLKAFVGHCQNLEALNLGRLMDIGPQITDAGMQFLIPHCVTLKSLDLSWLDGLTDKTIVNVADSCTKLESLDVPNLYQLTNASIARLGSSPCHSTLTNLNLYGCCYIGDAAAFVVAQKFFNMMTLNLAGCDRIGPEAIIEIVSRLRLKSLNITGLYRLNDKCLLDMGPYVGDLIRLRMGYLRCTDEGVGSLAKGLKNLTQFDMRGISDITDLTVVVMCQNMNNLRVVDMRGCRNITVSARLMLAAKLEKNAILGELRMTTAIYADGC